MPSPKTFTIQGRLGEYTLTLSRLTGQDFSTGRNGVHVLEKPVISYGEQSIERESMPILKSTMRLTFADPRGALADNLSAGAIEASLVGPGGIDWLGRATSRMSLEPLNYRTKPNELRIAFQDGLGALSDDQNQSVLREDTDQLNLGDGPSYAVALGQIANVARYGTDLKPEPVYIASNVNVNSYKGNAYTQADLNSLFAAGNYDGRTLEDDLKHILSTFQCRAFRSASTGKLWLVPAAQQTGTLTAEKYEYDPLGSNSIFGGTISQSTESVTLGEKTFSLLDDEDGYGVRGFKNAGKTRYPLPNEYNLVRNPDASATLNSTDPVHWPCDASQGAAGDVDGSPDGTVFLLGSGGTVETDSQQIGRFEPQSLLAKSPSGIILVFTGFKESSKASTPTLTATIEVDTGSGTTTSSKSEPDTFGEDVVVKLNDAPAGDLTIKFEGNDCAFYQPKVQFIEYGSRISDAVVYGNTDNSGIWEFSTDGHAKIDNFVAESYENTRFSVTRRLPFDAVAQDKLRRRPTGAEGIRTRVKGLHGPETRLVLTKPTGDKRTYYAGIGRRLHIKEGDTELFDTELPSSAQA